MKILFQKQQKEIENRICKLQVLLNQSDIDIEAMSQCTEELAEIAYAVSGVQGLNNIIAYLDRKTQSVEVDSNVK